MNPTNKSGTRIDIRSFLLPALLLCAAPARAVMNGEGQDIFPVTAVFQSSVTISYSDPANAALTVSSGMLVQQGLVGIGAATPASKLHLSSGTLTIDGNVARSINAAGDINGARYQVGGSTVLAVLTGTGNIAVGIDAGRVNSGNYNSFFGYTSGYNNSAAAYNVFMGYQSGYNNTDGGSNSFFGANAGFSNNTGTNNSFFGMEAGFANTTGANNAFLGYGAGHNTGIGSGNAFVGYSAGVANTDGVFNTFVGHQAGVHNTTGGNNTYLGHNAGLYATTGGYNIVIGIDQNLSAPEAANELNIGGVLFGKLNTRTIGISTRNPQAALDIVATGSAHTDMAQIWRDGGGDIISSMSATGVMKAAYFEGNGLRITGVPGDNLGNHVATTSLNMAQLAILQVGTITVSAGGLRITETAAAGSSGLYVSKYGEILNIGVGWGSAQPNARGWGTIDLQTRREQSTQVAASNYSTLSGGLKNTIEGNANESVIAGGTSNTILANGWNSVISGGVNNVVNGGYSAIPGGLGNKAAALYSFAAGYASTSAANGAFTWADSQGLGVNNAVADRTAFKNRGGFMVTGLTGTLGNNLGMLDVVSTATASDVMAQVWRNSGETVVASMSATGVMKANYFEGNGALLTGTGDNLGNHLATTSLNMSAFNIVNAGAVTAGSAITTYSSMTVAGNGGVYGLSVSSNINVAGGLFNTANGGVGIGTLTPDAKLNVYGGKVLVKDPVDDGTGVRPSFVHKQGSSELVKIYDKSGQGNGYIRNPAAVLYLGNQNTETAITIGWDPDHTANTGVGILKTDPRSALDVGGTAQLRGSASGTGLYVDPSGNVGIGTTTPSYGLQVVSPTGVYFSTAATANDGVYFDPNGMLAVGGKNAWDQTPKARLHIVSTGTYNGVYMLMSKYRDYGGTGTHAVKFYDYGDAALMEIGYTGMANGKIVLNGGSGAVGGRMGLYNHSGAETLHLDSNGYSIFNGGNVVIGSASAPRGKLDVYGIDSEIFVGAIAGQVGIIGNSRRLNYGDVLFGRNLQGTSGSDAYRTKDTATGVGYAGIELKFAGDVAIYGQNGDTTAGAAVTPTPRLYIKGDTGAVGLGRTAPNAALDVVSTGTAADVMAQIWRDSGGNIVSSVSAAGVIKAAYFEGNGSRLTSTPGDNLGSHVATATLQMGSFGIISSSGITAARYQVDGSTVLAKLRGANSLGVGIDAGQASTANDNSFVGYQAGYGNISGADNSFLGSLAGYTNTGSNNSIIGSHAGYYNEGADNNSFFGSYSGYSNTTGAGNSFFGFYSGGYTSNASGNSAFGAGAAKYTNGSANSVFGAEAGGFGNGAAGNFSSATIVGYQAGNKLQTGASDNILIGFKAGYAITTGTGNIVIGYAKDTSAATNSNELNIGGALFGKLDTKVIGIGRQIPQAALDVVSTASAHAQMAQIWRNGGGSIVSSMSATGVMKAIRFVGDGSGLFNLSVGNDNLGDHTATEQLKMTNYAIISSSDITAARYQVNGANVLIIPPGDGSMGVGIDAGSLVNSYGYANSFIGYQAGYSTIDAYSNTFVGYQSGYSNDSGTGFGFSNSFVGSLSGKFNIYGNYNVFMGAAAGYLNETGNNNTFIGYNSGASNTAGESNTFLGASAGYNNYDAGYNTFIGVNSGLYSITGGYNTVLGGEAGNGTSSGSSYTNSTLIGFQAGYALETGGNNIFLGYKAGDAVTSGSGNIVIGYDQDTSGATAANELNIGGAIFGDLSAAKNISIGSRTYLPTYKFSVDGTGYLNDAAWTYSSDRRLKENITPILSGLDIIRQLRPVRFDYIKGSKKQAGFIAQEVREVLPDIVTENSKGMLGMKTEAIIPYLVKAVQDQQKEIEELKTLLKARQ